MPSKKHKPEEIIGKWLAKPAYEIRGTGTNGIAWVGLGCYPKCPKPDPNGKALTAYVPAFPTGSAIKKLVPPTGLEPVTPALRKNLG